MANGQKVTRPGLKRNPTSQGRLAAVAANNSAAKLQPTLQRTKTSDSTTSPKEEHVKPAPESPFKSTIYCSRECAQVEAGRSTMTYHELARNLSFDYSNGLPPHLPPHLDPINTHFVTDQSSNPCGPPSPLFVSDTESSDRSNTETNSGPVSSAPKFMEYFRMPRYGPDDAWVEIQRQRRSSIQTPGSQRPFAMHRQDSQQSHHSQYLGEASSDSLSSLWHDPELNLARSVSGGAKFRGLVQMSSNDSDSHASGRRSMSSGSDRAVPIPARQLPRSNLSQASLSTSPARQSFELPAEFGSAPHHTFNLLDAYANAFPVRHPGTASSYTHKGFVYPGHATPSPASSRRGSMTTGSSATSLARGGAGTIRARKSVDVSWDTFGREAARSQNARRSVAIPDGRSDANAVYDNTPRQSLEVRDGRWQVKYGAKGQERRSPSRSSRSHSSISDEDAMSRRGSFAPHTYSPGLAIPRAIPLSTSTSTNSASGCTPRDRQMMPPPVPPTLARAHTAMPDIGTLNISSPVGSPSPQVGSAPKGNFAWKGDVKTYPIPKTLKVNTSKAGLFYFN